MGRSEHELVHSKIGSLMRFSTDLNKGREIGPELNVGNGLATLLVTSEAAEEESTNKVGNRDNEEARDQKRDEVSETEFRRPIKR